MIVRSDSLIRHPRSIRRPHLIFQSLALRAVMLRNKTNTNRRRIQIAGGRGRGYEQPEVKRRRLRIG
ncbi:hypothetical protein M8C21_019713 [Ambrosia artemisiifolia]|uniref:Uncharacterized protein n=1 Tax=Ambrosia artemisiifolia TaxID=4212 RepID=A0AAD5GPR2_AMBAR|nr:hypothetical protein M8C21_019713 [Ambrosia artemisiifolia]